MSDEGKVICQKKKLKECIGWGGAHCEPHINHSGCHKPKICKLFGEPVKCVPVSGEEAGK